MTASTTPNLVPPVSRRPSARQRRSGFSFTEVLFAVMILGVGFIMIAGVFPVSLSQVKLNNEESTAASIARGATSFLQRVADQTNANEIFRPTIETPPPTPNLQVGQVQVGSLYGASWSLFDPRNQANPQNPQHPNASPQVTWAPISGNLICPTDPRYAWVAVYRRDATYVFRGVSDGTTTHTEVSEVGDPYAQVTIIVVQSRARSIFTKGEDIDTGTRPRLAAWTARATLLEGQPFTFATQQDADLAGEGAYVVISDTGGNNSFMNGRVYRLGTRADGDNRAFDYVPGNDFQRDPGPDGKYNTADDVKQLTNVSVMVVGREIANGLPEGAARDVAAFTTYIKVK